MSGPENTLVTYFSRATVGDNGRCIRFESNSTASTNTDAIALATQGAADFTLVWAREQTAGRGRGGRRWISEPGDLFWSVILRGDRVKAHPEKVGSAAAMAIANTIRDTLPDPNAISIKRPNDVLINGAKFSRVLTGSNLHEGWVVVGLGINLKTSPAAGQMIYPATCLADAGSSIGSVDELCERFIAEFLKIYGLWEREREREKVSMERSGITTIGSCGSWETTSMSAGMSRKQTLSADTTLALMKVVACAFGRPTARSLSSVLGMSCIRSRCQALASRPATMTPWVTHCQPM
jgi:BirA family biotin operon repressor/biotin-[acetyl-CoA-carboxylase] ligase